MQDTRYRNRYASYRIQDKDTGTCMQETGYRTQITGYLIQDTDYRIQNAGTGMLDTGYRKQENNKGSRIQ